MSLLKIRDQYGKVHVISTFKGDKGDGVPDGGEAGQVLKKTADGTEWVDVDEVPEGGNAGQVLKKTADGVAWGDVSEVPNVGEVGQVLKKTEDGVAWGDITSNSTIYDNSNDISSETSCGIPQRGLYEVSVKILGLGDDAKRVRGLMSVSNLEASFRQCIDSGVECYLDYSTVNGIRQIGIYCTDANLLPYLSEVRLLIPYD